MSWTRAPSAHPNKFRVSGSDSRAVLVAIQTYDREFGWRASTVGKRKKRGGIDKQTYPSKTVGANMLLGKCTDVQVNRSTRKQTLENLKCGLGSRGIGMRKLGDYWARSASLVYNSSALVSLGWSCRRGCSFAIGNSEADTDYKYGCSIRAYSKTLSYCRLSADSFLCFP
jgi:hypothetical protein